MSCFNLRSSFFLSLSAFGEAKNYKINGKSYEFSKRDDLSGRHLRWQMPGLTSAQENKKASQTNLRKFKTKSALLFARPAAAVRSLGLIKRKI